MYFMDSNLTTENNIFKQGVVLFGGDVDKLVMWRGLWNLSTVAP